MRHRILLTAVATASLATLALPAQAAPKPKTLYLANEGGSGSGGCTTHYVLDVAVTGNPCSSIQAGYHGTGLISPDTFSAVKRATGFKISTKAHLTGVVYLATPSQVSGAPINTLPGVMGATITVSINGVKVGSTTSNGQALAPNTDVAIPLDMVIPATLNKSVAESIVVIVSYDTAAGIMGADSSGTNNSKIVIPTA